MKTIIPEFKYKADKHTVIENADFSVLDKMYAGRKAFYGDFHAHAATGGTSDGKTTLDEWKREMDKLGMDFVGILDHRQVRHMYLTEFDPKYFLYGTEPAAIITDEPMLDFHYLMIFEDRDTLRDVILPKNSKYEFTGGTEGHFQYKKYERAEFENDIIKLVSENGGTIVFAHPKLLMTSDNPEDYVLRGCRNMETIYSVDDNDALCEHTVEYYKLWCGVLANGHRICTTATSDCHGAPKNEGVNTVYTTERLGCRFVEKLKTGDLNAGFIGIKMCITDDANTAPVGGDINYSEELRILIKIDDVHSLKFDKNEAYRVDVISSEGLAYTAPLTIPFALSLKPEKRDFYRVEVIRERDGSPCAIGNPIWLNLG
ncbi:MAG: hypothetical protein IKJ13_05690 [Clostridia bacterium]|nr:hypothetical protein [Clostridia bacterium]